METKTKYTASILILLLSAFPAYAQKKVRVSLVVDQAENTLSCEQAKTAFNGMKKTYAEQLNINLKLRWFRCKNVPDAPDQNLKNGREVYYFWHGFFAKKNRYKGTKVLHIALIKPIKENGNYYIGGFAPVGAYRKFRPIAVVNAEPANSAGESRLKHAETGLKHEGGHLMWAEHDDSLPPTIMHPDAYRYTNDYPNGDMPFSLKSISEIKASL